MTSPPAEVSPCGILVIDDRGRVMEWTAALEKMTGLARSKALGQNLDELIARPLSKQGGDPMCLVQISQGFAGPFAGEIQAGVGSLREVEIQCPEGEKKVLQYLAVSLPGDHQNQLLVSVWDVTDEQFSIRLAERRAHLEKILMGISSRFVALPSEEIERGIELALSEIGSTLEADGGLVHLLDPDSGQIRSTLRWSREDGRSLAWPLGDDAFGSQPLLQTLQPFAFTRLEDFQPESRQEQERFAALGVRSLVSIPIVFHQTLLGTLVFFRRMEGEIAGSDLIPFLQTAADILASAVQSSRIETQWIESEKLFKALSEESPVGIYLFQDGVFRYVNPKFASMFDLRPEEIIDRLGIPDLVDAGSRPELYERIRQRIEGEANSSYYQLFGLRPDGRSFPAELFSSVTQYRGKPAIVGTVMDVTGRLYTEEAIRQSEVRYRSLFEDSPVALWEEDFSGVEAYLASLPKQGLESWESYFKGNPKVVEEAIRRVRILDVNQATMESLQVTNKEELIQNFQLTLSEGTRESFIRQILAIIKGQRQLEFETEGLTMQGKRQIWAIRWVVPDSSHLDYSKVLVSTIDVTAQREAAALLAESNRSVQKAVVGTIYAMARITEVRDPYTAGHQESVARLAAAIGRETGLDQERINGLAMAALIHDIGKVTIPAEILAKPGKLTSLEFTLIQTHPQSGYEILRGIEFPWPIAEMVLQHHERMDGSGYPRRLKRDEILLEARILGVADVVEAMASHRPYRPALGVSRALEEIEQGTGSSLRPQRRGRLPDSLPSEKVHPGGTPPQ